MDYSDENYKSTAVDIAALIMESSGEGSMALALLERIVIELIGVVSENTISDKGILSVLYSNVSESLLDIRMQEAGLV